MLPSTLLPTSAKVVRHKRDFEYLTDSQLEAELDRCLNCAAKPCEKGCPVNCSPADFIYAAKDGMKAGGANRISKHALARSAAEIMKMNPIGGVCGVICPDTFCMRACAREALDQPIDIPAVQATIVRNAREQQRDPADQWTKQSNKPKGSESGRFKHGESQMSVAVVGAGPSGLAAVAVLAQNPAVKKIVVYDRRQIAGGALRTIPESRLPTQMLEKDLEHIRKISGSKVEWRLGEAVTDFQQLADQFDAVCLATGLAVPRRMGIENEARFAQPAVPFLWKAKHDREEAKQLVNGKRVAVIGGGAVAVDAATTAMELGAVPGGVSLIYRRGTSEMPVTAKERLRLLDFGVDVIPRQVPVRFTPEGTLVTKRAQLPIKKSRLHEPHQQQQQQSSSADLPSPQQDSQGQETVWSDFDVVLVAIGDDSESTVSSLIKGKKPDNVYFAGDTIGGASTAVQSAAYGKNIAQKILNDFLLNEQKKEEVEVKTTKSTTPITKSYVLIPSYQDLPADISVDFFGRVRLANPFILSASPMSDGFEQVDDAFQLGWGGAFLKTTFDDVHFPVHVPNRYMERFTGDGTYGNCDNVSDHPMSRVTKEVRELVAKYGSNGPNLIGASTGGDMTGKIDHDRHSWQTNTRALEDAGAMAIEYSLSCPQGGEGAEASQIVSQSAVLAARVVDFVLGGAKKPEVPKLFKLTAAVASVRPIIAAILEVFAKYPHAKAGITLANSFPVMGFRENADSNDHGRKWPHGIIFGMAGAGVLPISYKTLSEATDAFPELYISANGGVMDSASAANVLALGCQSVQMCTLPTRDGLECIQHLNGGLAHILVERKLKSVSELIGIAKWGHQSSVKGFMDLPAKSQVSTLVHPETCISCGNCTRCPYDAIVLHPDNQKPIIDPEKCVACTMCILKCPSQSLELRNK